MYGWSKWLAALAIGAALVGVPAAEAATVPAASGTSHKLVLVKTHKGKHHQKKHRKHTVHKSVKKSVSASAIKGKEGTALAKSTLKKSPTKWHHPQLHNA